MPRPRAARRRCPARVARARVGDADAAAARGPRAPRPRGRIACASYSGGGADVLDVMRSLAQGAGLSLLSGTALRSASSALARRAARDALLTSCARVFGVADEEELQDLLACLVLSECVYKKLEMPPAALGETIAGMLGDFPRELVHLEAVQLSRDDVPQKWAPRAAAAAARAPPPPLRRRHPRAARLAPPPTAPPVVARSYLVAVGGRAVYVAFMGTKQARDIGTDLAFAHEAIWAAEEAAGSAPGVPTAHRGFLARSKAVPIEQLQALAQASGRRLVLCGHSLGGAVAKLAGLRLLRDAPQWPPPALRVVCFATPAVGSDALARLVEQAGWGQYFRTYVLPEDQLMRILRFAQAAAPATGARSPGSSSPGGSSPGGGSPGGGSPGGSQTGSPYGTAVVAPAGGQQPAAQQQEQGLGPAVAAVAGVLQRPFVQESAKQQLRRELGAEEASTTSLDTATMDFGEAATGGPAAAAAATAATAAAAAAAGADSVQAAGAPGGRPPSAAQQSIARRVWGVLPRRQPPSSGEPAAGAGAASAGPADAAASAADAAAGPVDGGGDGGEPAAAAAAADEAGGGALSLARLGLVLQLQGRWLGYQLGQALAPLSSARAAVSVFHPFGAYAAITVAGVVPLADAPPPDGALAPEAAAFARANPGPFSFHRMLAYRTRALALVARVAAELRGQGLALPPPGGAPPPVRMGGVLPRMRVACALARPPLRSPTLALAPADDSLAGLAGAPPPGDAGAGAGTGAAAAPRRSSLTAFLPSGRAPEPRLQLVLQVSGANLHLCTRVGLLVGGEAFVVDQGGGGLAAAAPRPPAAGDARGDDADGGNRWAPLHVLAPVLTRLRQATVAAAKAAEGDRPRWRAPLEQRQQLALTVLLPVSVVERLTAHAAAGGGGDELVLQLASDFEVVSVPVQLQPHVVGVVGSSPAAATLVAALLSQSGAAKRRHVQQAAAAATAASAGGAPGSYRAAAGAAASAAAGAVGDKARAAASLAAAASASVAASRLATLSRQLLGRRAGGPVLAGDEPPAKRARPAAGGAGAGAGASPQPSLAGTAQEPASPLPSPQPPAQAAAVRGPAVASAGLLSRLTRGGSGGAGGAAGWSSGAGLRGVAYETLPLGPPLLPLPPGAPGAPALSLSRVLRRATKQLHQQAAARAQGATGAAALLQRALRLTGSVAGAPRTATPGAEQQPAGGTAALGGGKAGGSRTGGGGAAPRAPSPPRSGAGVGARAARTIAPASAAPRARRWDVLLLAVTFDGDCVELLRRRAALGGLAAAARAAGVAVVPVLLLEGQESGLTLAGADLRAAGIAPRGGGDAQRGQAAPALLRIDDAAAALAAALHAPSAPVFRLPAQRLLGGADARAGGDATALLRGAGDLEQQAALLLAAQRLEGHLAGLLAARHGAALGLPRPRL
ncbi:hypothetical protein HT031_005589 [Scenedesmus sp. PABB004]|nr:hypothetical protein HT031_005589 [Scenedesmus sp. PABB004]